MQQYINSTHALKPKLALLSGNIFTWKKSKMTENILERYRKFQATDVFGMVWKNIRNHWKLGKCSDNHRKPLKIIGTLEKSSKMFVKTSVNLSKIFRNPQLVFKNVRKIFKKISKFLETFWKNSENFRKWWGILKTIGICSSCSINRKQQLQFRTVNEKCHL